MPTATNEVNNWIIKYGNARDALNVALAKLRANELYNEAIEWSIQNQMDAMLFFDIRIGMRFEPFRYTVTLIDDMENDKVMATFENTELSAALQETYDFVMGMEISFGEEIPE